MHLQENSKPGDALLMEERDALYNSLTPFADAIFYDNGDITLVTVVDKAPLIWFGCLIRHDYNEMEQLMKNTWRTHEEVKVDWSVERHVKCRSEEDPVRNHLADYIRGRDTLKGYRQTLVLAGHS